jgi:hypothetical protein
VAEIREAEGRDPTTDEIARMAPPAGFAVTTATVEAAAGRVLWLSEKLDEIARERDGAGEAAASVEMSVAEAARALAAAAGRVTDSVGDPAVDNEGRRELVEAMDDAAARLDSLLETGNRAGKRQSETERRWLSLWKAWTKASGIDGGESVRVSAAVAVATARARRLAEREVEIEGAAMRQAQRARGPGMLGATSGAPPVPANGVFRRAPGGGRPTRRASAADALDAAGGGSQRA